MRKTRDITFHCKITGTASYWLEFQPISGLYTFCREVDASIYNRNNTTDFLNPVYVINNSIGTAIQMHTPTSYLLRIPIQRDPVVMQDFYAYEDKTYNITLPAGSTIDTSKLRRDPFGILQPLTSPIECQHEPHTYVGLNYTDIFCKKCQKKLD